MSSCVAVRTPTPEVKAGFESPVAVKPNWVWADGHRSVTDESKPPRAPSPAPLSRDPPSGEEPSPAAPSPPPAPSGAPASPPSTSEVSKHAPARERGCGSQTCPPAHWFIIRHGVRHWSSVAQRRPVGHGLAALQALSCGSSHTPVVPEMTQRSPVGQSRVAVHSLWHRPKAQMRGELQSLLIEQSAAIAADLVQLTASATATIRTVAQSAARILLRMETSNLGGLPQVRRQVNRSHHGSPRRTPSRSAR